MSVREMQLCNGIGKPDSVIGALLVKDNNNNNTRDALVWIQSGIAVLQTDKVGMAMLRAIVCSILNSEFSTHHVFWQVGNDGKIVNETICSAGLRETLSGIFEL